MNERVEETKANLRDKAETVRNMAQEAGTKASASVRDSAAWADLYAREYLWTSLIGVAVVSGVVGYLLGRRS